MNLNLKRPIAFFDLETTGLNIAHDRIVEIAILRIDPDGKETPYQQFFNPEMTVSPEAAAVHGYTNEFLADKPTFKDKAEEVKAFFADSDLAGYNILKFDLPLLVEEFLRVGCDFSLEKCHFIDVMNIFMKMEPRTLKGAYRFFCHSELVGAHGAQADTAATYEVLKAMLDKYEGVDYEDSKGVRSQGPVNDMIALSEFSAHHKNADLCGQIIFDDEEKEVFQFGKYKGKRVEDVFRAIDPNYYSWMMNSDFPLYTKKLITTIEQRVQEQKKLQRLKEKWNPTNH